MKKILLLSLLFIITSCSNQKFGTVSNSSDRQASGVYSTKVDVLWVIDTSYTTMVEHQNRIADKMQDFYDTLKNSNADFQIAATTMNMASFGEKGQLVENGLIITNKTKNPVEALKKLIKQGGDGSSSERGLDALKEVLNNQSSFFRKDALFAVTFLGDEDDVSFTTSDMAKNLLDQKLGENTDTDKKWIANFIGIIDSSDPECITSADYHSVGTRFISLATYSGGVVESICKTDFSSVVAQIRARLKYVLNRYKLEYLPLLDSISVKKNGTNIREDSVNGWSYNETTNEIILNGEARPNLEDKITINYEIEGKI